MPTTNYALRQITFKIVYYGPGMGGKTTNLEHIYEHVAPETRGRLISLATESDRTLLFDFLPVDLGQVQGFHTRFHLYTVPGQQQFEVSRKLVVKGADGVVFVADSRPAQLEENLESMGNLHRDLARYQRELASVPFVVQYNKRDLPGVMPLAELQQRLNPGGAPHFEAVATRGVGVFETLRAIGRQVVASLR